MKKIQAISVCVNYSDFFCHTAEVNNKLFDKWVVVTDTKDLKTKAVCEQYGIICVQTDLFYENARFNKFAGINEALTHIDKDAWVLFLDSDIVLPPHTRRVLDEMTLDKKCLYGIDRVNCFGINNWLKYKSDPSMLVDSWLLQTSTVKYMPFGARIVHIYGQEGENGKFGGYKPLGFFHLVHRSSFEKYPQNSLGADHCDLVFANLYGRQNRVLIPEIIGIHLESEGAGWGDNWKGRKTIAFGEERTSKIILLVRKIYWLISRLIRWIIKKLFCKKLRYR